MSQPMTNHSSTAAANPVLGVLLVSSAVFLFALSDVVTKQLTASYSVPLIAAVRYTVSFAILFVLFAPKLGTRLWLTQRTWLVMLRSLCLAAATLTMGWALRVMPVGETVAIIYLSPFAVMLLAVPLLGEKVGIITWVGAVLGFFGVLLIVRPGSGLDPLGVVFALTNAGLATAYHLLTRVLSRTETTIAMLFHSAWVGAILFCALSLPTLPESLPPATDIVLLVALGVLMTGGHFLFTSAYRQAPASLLAPANYLHLFWAGGLGWLVFGHVPDFLSIVGMALISCAGITIAWISYWTGQQHRKTTAAGP